MKLARIVALVAAAAAASACQRAARPAPSREDAYRANNRGVALLEQFNAAAAVDAFRQAGRIDPSLALARVNLAIALFYVPDLDAAEREAADAGPELPRDPHPPYLLGLIERARGRDQQARAAFQRVLQIDPADVGSHINLGQLDLQQQRYDEAMAHFRAALAEEPYSITATYNLALALMRAGRRDEGQRTMERSQTLRTTGYGTLMSADYLEQGQYAAAVASAGAEPDLVDRAVPDVTFTRMAASTGSDGGGITLLDFDGDGDLDVCAVSAGGVRLLRNDHGAFVDVTAASGLAAAPGGVGAVAGDYDNDGRPDVLVLRRGGGVLYHNDGNGRFSASQRAVLPQYPSTPETAAFVDIDHDGDLDLVLAGSDGPVQVVRNNGNGTFTDITAHTGVGGASHAFAVVPTDFDNRRDVDLLIVRRDGPPALFRNLRDGSFADVATDAGLRIDGRVTSVAAGDVNKDEFPDFFFGRAGAAGVFALSTGRGRFRIAEGPPGSADAVAAQLFDYDNDGLLDLLTWSAEGPHLFRNIGDGWTDVTAHAFAQASAARGPQMPSGRALVSADIDGDGDIDVIAGAAAGRVDLWRNDGGNAHASVRVRLTGRASNRAGVGAKIDIRAGSVRQRLETSSATPAVAPADVVFGLGSRDRADVVRVLWPSGILQAETTVRSPLAVEELNRKPSSCPFLYTWNGTRFEFVSDFMGGGEMGYWEAPGVRNTPDSDEYVRIRDDQLQPRDGRYELRVTDELEEALFVDRLQLLAVTHPADVEIFPNEGMTDPPKPFRLFGVRDLTPPVRAVDEHGHDVTPRIARRDRQYVDDFERSPFRGYASPHTLTVTLPPLAAAPLLLLTGWTDYAFSSDNVAARQAGLALQPPRLDIRDRQGGWRTLVDDIGVPVGRPQTIVVDLGRHLPAGPGPTEVRIITNMRIYWDQILIGTPVDARDVRVDRIDPSTAQLRWRGFSLEVAPDGRQPTVYDYDRVTAESPWKTPPGRYTREGDVRPLLARVDDQFVIARPGDEIALSFDATRVGAPPLGSKHTFLLFADGFSKEMDINSASPDRLDPLPFHAMTRYPYPQREHYPDTPALRRYQREYNTRIVVAPMPPIDLATAREGPRPGTRP